MNSPRQYHWSPAGYTASKAVFQAGSGTGAIPSSSGLPKARASRSASDSSSPDCVQATPHTLRRCSSSGNGGAGGTGADRKKTPHPSGAGGRKARDHARTPPPPPPSDKTRPPSTGGTAGGGEEET